MTHDHSWLRLPVTDTTVTYACEGCPEQHRVTWLRMIPSVSHMDQLVRGSHGGMVRGDCGQVFPLTLSSWILEMHKTGLFAPVEDLMTPEDENA